MPSISKSSRSHLLKHKHSVVMPACTVVETANCLVFLQRMLPAFAACTGELIRRWEDAVGSDGMQEIDVWPEFQNLTGDVISRAAFGSSFSEGRRIFQLQSEQAQNAVEMARTMHIPAYR